MRIFGLIGRPLGHSFSGSYFARKFREEKIEDASYDLYELQTIDEVTRLFQNPELRGLNVTIPYKQEIGQYLDEVDEIALKIGAINVVRIDRNGYKKGFNSDYFGFRASLVNWVPATDNTMALVLGTGGSSKAVAKVLQDMDIAYTLVSRDESKGLTYRQLHNNLDILGSHGLIINTTPLGMAPDTDEAPDLPYDALSDRHYLYDLIYNPTETAFMQRGRAMGAQTKNGQEMLELQAEKSWEIWNS